MNRRRIVATGMLGGGASTPNYYVSKLGDDGTGDGSLASPWLTVTKALSTIPLTGGILNVGDGTYAENTSSTGRLVVTQQFTSELRIRPESDTLGDVIIDGADSGDKLYNVYLNNASNVTFEKIDFTTAIAVGQSVIYDDGGSFYKFDGCRIVVPSAATVRRGIETRSTDTTIVNCVFTQTGTDKIEGIGVTSTGGGAVSERLAIETCTFTNLYGKAVSTSWPVGGLTITDCDISMAGGDTTSSAGVYIHTSMLSATVITNCTITSVGMRGVLAKNSVTITDCDFTSNYICIDATDGANFTCSISGSTFVNTQTAAYYAIKLGLDGFSANKNQTYHLTNNTITGGNHCVLIGGTTANGSTMTGNTINAGVYGLVTKATGLTIDGNIFNGRSMTSWVVLFKNAVSNIFENNTITTAYGSAIRMTLGDSAPETCSNNNLNHNTVTCTSAAKPFFWPLNADGGGNIVDYNAYTVAGADWGTILGTPISSLATLRAAWSAYGDGSNDSHST